jgi:prolyl-tRNA editing enzyme YbaK/EbsC (Cys-tRNA(Pro) deacylase)
MQNKLSSSAQNVQDTLRRLGFNYRVIELPQTTRTSREAAQAIGCRVEQIAKSLVFRGSDSRRPVLVIASGVNRVDEGLLREMTGEIMEKPDAAFVLEKTGFVIGGVAPIGHREPLVTYVDADLMQYDEIWAAAGNPFAVFKLRPHDLVKMTGGQVVEVKQRSG